MANNGQITFHNVDRITAESDIYGHKNPSACLTLNLHGTRGTADMIVPIFFPRDKIGYLEALVTAINTVPSEPGLISPMFALEISDV